MRERESRKERSIARFPLQTHHILVLFLAIFIEGIFIQQKIGLKKKARSKSKKQKKKRMKSKHEIPRLRERERAEKKEVLNAMRRTTEKN